ncbi:hypothetical protein [Mesorhizobium jarvisii]|uniref:hypothetical protein n=1 Tax=Mesorhizobium jarvisii TaxID=1777867 RepID=UPI001F0AD329|nr:hypothetical protein [Mesorhizobium jarvisii]MCH4560333.1 hypothetical protein [Mesorhizobium jarvisii]
METNPRLIDRRSFVGAALATVSAAIAAPGAMESPALLPLSRQEKIKACIEQLDALLSEETGLPSWQIFMASNDLDGKSELRILISDKRHGGKGLHDPTGIVGRPLRYGEPI